MHQFLILQGDEEGTIFVSASERLANFHMKYNQVVMDNIAIDKERERLSYENAQVYYTTHTQHYIKQHNITPHTTSQYQTYTTTNTTTTLHYTPYTIQHYT